MDLMGILQIVVIIAIIGVVLWAVNTYVPMDARVKQILNAVAIIALIVWLLFWVLSLVGLIGHPPPPIAR